MKQDTQAPNKAPGLAEERIAHVILQVGRGFRESLERRLTRHGVSFGFWAYLRVLWNEEGLSQRELSERVGLTGPTTHSVIRRMEAAGLVELRPIVEGKPRRAVYLSQRGRDLQNVLVPLAEDVNAVACAGLSAQEVAQLRDWLLRINGNLAGSGREGAD